MALEQISTPKIIKVVIFWDYENVSFKSANLIQFLKNIPSVERNICKIYNASNNNVENISLKRVFADWTKICSETQNIIRDAGFELIQVPNTGKNSSDNGLKRNAREIIKLIQPNVFLLISVDGDYIDLLNEQKRAGIFRAFIGREHSVSRDLKEVVDLYYFVESEGKIFEYTKITKESAIQIIENAVEDAYAALKNLEKDSNPETLCIFPFSQWRDAFARLETFKNPNLALYQIIGLKDLFKIMAQRYGIAHSFDYEWICSKPLFTEKSIQEILVQNPEYNINEPKDVISSLLPLDEKEIEKIFKELACPNKEPKQELQRNNINNTQATEAKDNSKCAEAKEIKEKIPSSNKKEEEKEAQFANDRDARKKYLENLADLILNSFNLEKIAKRNLLAISEIDNAYKKQNFGTRSMEGKEHYKKFGYSKFSKAVDDAVSLLNQRSDLNKEFVIIKNSMQNYIKCQ
jgi:hypothetical protein